MNFGDIYQYLETHYGTPAPYNPGDISVSGRAYYYARYSNHVAYSAAKNFISATQSFLGASQDYASYIAVGQDMTPPGPPKYFQAGLQIDATGKTDNPFFQPFFGYKVETPAEFRPFKGEAKLFKTLTVFNANAQEITWGNVGLKGYVQARLPGGLILKNTASTNYTGSGLGPWQLYTVQNSLALVAENKFELGKVKIRGKEYETGAKVSYGGGVAITKYPATGDQYAGLYFTANGEYTIGGVGPKLIGSLYVFPGDVAVGFNNLVGGNLADLAGYLGGLIGEPPSQPKASLHPDFRPAPHANPSTRGALTPDRSDSAYSRSAFSKNYDAPGASFGDFKGSVDVLGSGTRNGDSHGRPALEVTRTVTDAPDYGLEYIDENSPDFEQGDGPYNEDIDASAYYDNGVAGLTDSFFSFSDVLSAIESFSSFTDDLAQSLGATFENYNFSVGVDSDSIANILNDPGQFWSDLKDLFSGIGDLFSSIGSFFRHIFPVVLDLDGTGIKINPLTSSNFYVDTAGDGLQHRTAWAGVGNGVLFLDTDGTGKITQKNQFVFTEWDPTAKTDMEALLSVFDTNKNGQLDAGDAKFAQFKVMVTNADGTQTAKTLAQAGVASINLVTDATHRVFSDGSTIDGQTSFTRTAAAGGGIGTVATVALVTESAGYAVTKTTVVAGTTTTITNKALNVDGSLASQIVTATTINGANDRSITTTYDLDGDGAVDLTQTIRIVPGAGGGTVETLKNFDVSGVMLDQTITTTAANGTITIQRDTDGSGGSVYEQTEVLSTDAAGVRTDAITDRNADGSVRSKSSVTTYVGGMDRTEQIDINGDSIWDTTEIHNRVLEETDNSRTEYVRFKAGTTEIAHTVDYASKDGRTRWTTFDLDGNNTVDLRTDETIAADTAAPGAQWVTQITKNGNGSERSRTQTWMSSDNLNKKSYVDLNGDLSGTAWEIISFDDTVVSANGDRTQTVTNYNGSYSLHDKTVTFKGIDGRTRTVQVDSNGDTRWDLVETVQISNGTLVANGATLAAGSSLDTVTSYSTVGAVTGKSMTITSPNGLTVTTLADVDGNGTFDTKNVTVTTLGGAGASTVVSTDTNGAGTVSIGKTQQTRATATGAGTSTVTVTSKSDINGDGVFDVTTVDETIGYAGAVAPNPSETQTITQTSANGSLLSKSTIQTSADHKTVTVTTDANGDTKTDQISTTGTGADGSTTATISTYKPNGGLIAKTVETIDDSGLIKTTTIDENGDAVIDTRVQDATVLNADGTRAQTVTSYNADGTWRDQQYVWTSANGLDKNIHYRVNGGPTWSDNTYVRTTLSADGSRVEDITVKNADGTVRGRDYTWTSDDGFSSLNYVDANGDLKWDAVTSKAVTIGFNGDTTETTTVTNGGGARRFETQSIVTNNGQNRTAYVDANGDGVWDRTDAIYRDAAGAQWEYITDTNADGTMRERVAIKTTANGLSTTRYVDVNGDALWDTTTIDNTVVNADGSRGETVTVYNRNGTLRAQSAVTTSANGLTTTTTESVNGISALNTTTTDAITIAADGSRTEVVSVVDSVGALTARTKTVASRDGRRTTVTDDNHVNGVIKGATAATVVIQDNGDTVRTTAHLDASAVDSYNGNIGPGYLTKAQVIDNWEQSIVAGTARDPYFASYLIWYALRLGLIETETLSASGLSRTTTRDFTGDGTIDRTRTDIIVLNANGSRTETVTNYAGTTAAAVIDRVVTTISDDGLSTTATRTGTNGYNTLGSSTSDVTVLNLSGSSTRTVTVSNSGFGAQTDKAIITTAANGLKYTRQLDFNNDGRFEKVETAVTNLDGSQTQTETDYKLDGALRQKETVTTSPNVLLHGRTLERDTTGDGIVDHFETDRINKAGALVGTVWETAANGALKSRVVVTTSDDELSKSVEIDANGDGIVDSSQTTVGVLNADGSRSHTVADFNGNGTLRARGITTTTANGLSKTTQIDTNGDGTIDKTVTDVTVVNTDGSRVRTVTDSYAGGVLKDKTTTTISADGYTTKSSIDSNGDGTEDRNVTSFTPVDGGNTTSGNFAVGTSFSSSTSVDGLTTTISNSKGVVETTSFLPDSNGSYSWLQTQSGRAITISGTTYYPWPGTVYYNGYASHSIDNNGVDTWVWAAGANVPIPFQYASTWYYTNSFNGGSQRSIVIDVETEAKYQAIAARIYDTVVDRDITTNERELLAGYITNGVLDTKRLADDLLVAGNLLWIPGEFGTKYGSLTNSEFVELMYQNTLGRGASLSELASTLTPLNAGTITRADVITGLAEGIEHIAVGNAHAITNNTASGTTLALDHTTDKTVAKDMVTRLYQSMLARDPTAAELTADSDWLLAGSGTEASLAYYRVHLIDQAFANASNGNWVWDWWPYSGHYSLTDVSFVAQVFQNSFGRAPTAAESSTWTTMLVNGQINRWDLVVAVAESPEHFAYIGSKAGTDVVASNVTLTYAANAIVNITGSGDIVNAGSGAILTLGGNGQNGTAHVVNMTNGRVNLNDGANVTVTGAGNAISLGKTDRLTIGGNSNTVVAASGDIVTINSGTGTRVNATGATISVAANLDVDVIGGGNTVNGVAGSSVTIGGNGPAGATDVVNLSSGKVTVTDDARVTINGASNTIVVGRGDSVTVVGNANTIMADVNDIFWLTGDSETVAFHASFGQSTINGFGATGTTHDTIQFDRNVFADWAQVLAGTTQSGVDTLITSGNGDVLKLSGTTSTSLTSADFRFV